MHVMKKFDEILNGPRGKGKGKGKNHQHTTTEKDVNYLPLTHSSHANTSKYPFMIDMAVVDDRTSHWETWKELWQNATALASQPFSAARPFDQEL